MKASGNRIGGYDTVKKRLPATSAGKSLRQPKRSAKDAKAGEALEAMFTAMRELLEAQRRAYTGEYDMEEYAAAMRKLLRYLRRKVKESVKKR